MSIFNWLRGKPKYSIWIDITDNGKYIARIVEANDAAKEADGSGICLKTIFMLPVNCRRNMAETAWADAIQALHDVGAYGYRRAPCYVEKAGGGVTKYNTGLDLNRAGS